MSSESPDQEQHIIKKKEEKKPQIIVKLEWIFGIRKDFLQILNQKEKYILLNYMKIKK